MKVLRQPEWLNEIWAKSPDKGENNLPETLAQHTTYVLERLTDFIRLRPDLPARLNQPVLWHILFWATFFHDFGKALPGFQKMLRPQSQSKVKQYWEHRHEVFSLAFLEWFAGTLSTEEHQWVVAAIVSHHKDADEIELKYPAPEEGEDDPLDLQLQQLDNGVLHNLWKWANDCSAEWILALELEKLGVRPLSLMDEAQAVSEIKSQGTKHIRQRLKLYRQLRKTLDNGSEQDLFTALIALRGHLINADHSASAHAGRMPRLMLETSNVLASRKLTKTELFPHQQEASEINGDTLLIAPTGSGKTEAALLWATRQAKNGSLSRLFYTLPYQASMNAMYLRLEDSFGEDHVGLQHGRALLALYRMLMERNYDPKDAARQTRWARNLAKLNFKTVRVFSPYQMLKGIYRLKGYEALLSDYHGAAFIFDEIHAYEVKRLALILPLMAHLRQYYDARFFVMSATFPTIIKTLLRNTLDMPSEISAAPELFQSFQRHQLHLLEGDLLNDLPRIATTARQGKKVLVVCNTVKRAQDVYGELGNLRTEGIPVELLHGRFNMRDRSKKESLIRTQTGTHSLSRTDAIVLVATQVVEVSLDIDLDTIFTDPAPLEALVQRFGRINRGRKQINLAPVHIYREPADGQKIYDPTLVERTLKVLEREDRNPLNESAVGDWLDEIYAGEVQTKWQQEYATCATDFETALLKTLRPFQSLPHLEEKFYAAFDGTEVLPAQFEAEYTQLKENDPILAQELLVPISIRQLNRLRAARRLLYENEFPIVVNVPYSSEIGLDLNNIGNGIPIPREYVD